MKEEISFTNSFHYPLCLNGQCPKAATCLRQLAMQSTPTERDYWKIISSTPCHRQRGMPLLPLQSEGALRQGSSLKHAEQPTLQQAGIAIANLIAGFGQRTDRQRPQR